MDIRAEDFDAGLLVVLQERRAGEANEHGPRQDRLHRLVQFAGLGPVAFIHKNEDFALRGEPRRQRAADLFDIALEIAVFSAAEFMDQGAEQPGAGIVEVGD